LIACGGLSTMLIMLLQLWKIIDNAIAIAKDSQQCHCNYGSLYVAGCCINTVARQLTDIIGIRASCLP
jgi:hypothetical protein